MTKLKRILVCTVAGVAGLSLAACSSDSEKSDSSAATSSSATKSSSTKKTTTSAKKTTSQRTTTRKATSTKKAATATRKATTAKRAAGAPAGANSAGTRSGNSAGSAGSGSSGAGAASRVTREQQQAAPVVVPGAGQNGFSEETVTEPRTSAQATDASQVTATNTAQPENTFVDVNSEDFTKAENGYAFSFDNADDTTSYCIIAEDAVSCLAQASDPAEADSNAIKADPEGYDWVTISAPTDTKKLENNQRIRVGNNVCTKDNSMLDCAIGTEGVILRVQGDGTVETAKVVDSEPVSTAAPTPDVESDSEEVATEEQS
ncbi:hypothetical protein EML15_07220 [Corynebacterium sp. sy017]|uniref:hypothetical protein n=1 Tax=unclassified Corynebacterium TaxID=2624378 RepID=UPI001185109B|nr:MULTISPECIES: hypothetical protein [unclassified Corynebacterium]MBP3088933.1 hypothetical protein [Corynebacterium sp. sy017]QDZ42309.1 hypothetical protein FQV43_03380 [Corynebacterium sp. sy039]TSD91261.1 hypothetical protein ELY17_07230 [Corynebacterium sp. SY003]